MAHPTTNPDYLNAHLFFVLNRGKSAKRASVTAYAETLRGELDAWQRELTQPGREPELTTVVVVTASGNYFAHVGPLDQYRRANLRRAGVSFPGEPSTDRLTA
jgi:hypothetical protein